jgi:gas vesicle protein
MSGVIAGAVIGGGALVYAANKSSKSANKALKGADKSAQLQYDISQQQIDLSIEQWEIYKNDILPLEMEAQQMGISAQELAMQRGELDLKAYNDFYLPMQEEYTQQAMEGIEADPERAARDARMDMDQAFDSAEGTMQRSQERRGVRPGSGGDRAGLGDTSLARAAATGYSVNRAVEGERDRVEDVNFNRLGVALGRQPLANNPTQSPGSPGVTAGMAGANLAGAGNTAYGAGEQYGNIGRTYGNAAGGIISGGMQLGSAAYDMYNKYRTPSTGFPSGGGYNYAMSGGYGTTPGSQQSSMLADQNAGFAEGGPVEAPMLGRGGPPPGQGNPMPGGQVSGPPGRDRVPAVIQSPDGGQYNAQLTDDEYVIPADVVRQVGTDPLDKIIEDARASKMQSSGQNSLTRSGGM